MGQLSERIAERSESIRAKVRNIRVAKYIAIDQSKLVPDPEAEFRKDWDKNLLTAEENVVNAMNAIDEPNKIDKSIDLNL